MAKKSEVNKNIKVETVEEYIARGGSVCKLPEVVREPQVEVVRTSNTGDPAVFLSLEDADLFYGQARKGIKPKKVKPSLKIDLDALPPVLRAKFIAKLKEDIDGEGYEEELEEISSEDDEEIDD